MDLRFILIITAVVKGLAMCNIRVCLTWTVQENYLDLKCRVNFLIYGVKFINNKNEEQGFCVHPRPYPSCYPSNSDIIIKQNSTTNITYLRILGHIDSHYNGEWACKHGTNRDSATINVTVLQSDPRKGKLVTDKRCWQSYLAYTMIGFFCAILFGIWIDLICRTKCTLSETNWKKFQQGCQKITNFKKANTIKIIVVLCVICALFLIPVIKEEYSTTTPTPDHDESAIPMQVIGDINCNGD